MSTLLIRVFGTDIMSLVAESDKKMHIDFVRNRIGEVVLSTNEPYDIPLKRFFTGVAKMRWAYARVQ